jgi:hypothetical protein|tara:strand:+ start:292 stop:456 length:165 start_codon:yes stop_codon:yes gene_type:complete
MDLTLLIVANVWVGIFCAVEATKQDSLAFRMILTAIAALNICLVIYKLLPQGVV